MTGLRDALHGELARAVTVVAVEVDLLGGEAELRIALCVEEVRRLQMRGEVLVLDVDARDLGHALEGRAGLADDELSPRPHGTGP